MSLRPPFEPWSTIDVTVFDVDTTHGRITVVDVGSAGPTVLLIHGNSACKEIFARQFDSRLTTRFRLIAFDLPGHGASSDAIDPERTYHIPGYADAALEVLRALHVDRLAIFGWSLGGHVGIELLARDTADVEIAGLAITGTPPIGHNPADFAAGFLPSPHMDLTGKDHFSDAEIADYARSSVAAPAPFLAAAVRRTDPRARRLMMAAALAGRGADQRNVVTTNATPIAVITGANEPFVSSDYLTAFPYRNLWERRVFSIPETGHAPFWERAEIFNPLFERFLTDVLI
jgi:pimeloyl-ACP methyl ester carboxylesterase